MSHVSWKRDVLRSRRRVMKRLARATDRLLRGEVDNLDAYAIQLADIAVRLATRGRP